MPRTNPKNPPSCLTAETEIRKVRKGLALLLDENSFKYIGSHARSRKYGFVTSKFEEVVNILASNIKNYMGSWETSKSRKKI